MTWTASSEGWGVRRHHKPKNDDLNALIIREFFRQKLEWVQKNRNRVIFLVGDIGSGKSVTALTYKYILDSMKAGHPISPNEFEWEDITFDPKMFLQRVNEAPEHVIIFDEAGVGAHARRWYDAANIALSQAAQVFRYKRNIILATVPRLKMVDKHLRDVAHEIHVASGVFVRNRYNIVFPRMINYNANEDKTYFVRYRMLVPVNGKHVQIMLNYILVPMPPRWLYDEYEKLQAEFKDSVLNQTLQTLEKLEAPEEEKKPPKQLVTEALKVLREYPEQIEKITKLQKRKGRVVFSPSKLVRWPYVDIDDSKTASIVASKLTYLVFGDPEGALEFEYKKALLTGEIINWIEEAMKGGRRVENVV